VSPRIRHIARRDRNVLLPLAVIVLGVVWVLNSITYSLQEGCDPDCVTKGEVTTWQSIFFVVLGLWIVSLLDHFAGWLRRRRNSPTD
jgi:hypothetical protein